MGKKMHGRTTEKGGGRASGSRKQKKAPPITIFEFAKCHKHIIRSISAIEWCVAAARLSLVLWRWHWRLSAVGLCALAIVLGRSDM